MDLSRLVNSRQLDFLSNNQLQSNSRVVREVREPGQTRKGAAVSVFLLCYCPGFLFPSLGARAQGLHPSRAKPHVHPAFKVRIDVQHLRFLFLSVREIKFYEL